MTILVQPTRAADGRFDLFDGHGGAGAGDGRQVAGFVDGVDGGLRGVGDGGEVGGVREWQCSNARARAGVGARRDGAAVAAGSPDWVMVTARVRGWGTRSR